MMATATTPTAWKVGYPPTEDEVRAIVADALAEGHGLNLHGELSDAVNNAVGKFVDSLYDVYDMRESEIQAFDEIVSKSVNATRRRMFAALAPALVAGLVEFAAAHPDAPRAKVEPAS